MPAEKKSRHNDDLIAEGLKKGIDALAFLSQMRLDFIESKGLLKEYFAYMKEKVNYGKE